MSQLAAKAIISQIEVMDNVFGLFYEVPTTYFSDYANTGEEIGEKLEQSEVPDDILDLILQRKGMKMEKKFAEADEIRDTLRKEGFWVKDVVNGGFEVWKL